MAKAEDQDREQRTTAMGLYTFAQSYLRAAEHVSTVKLRHDAPKYFLYAHTMELALKAYLRATGTSVAGPSADRAWTDELAGEGTR